METFPETITLLALVLVGAVVHHEYLELLVVLHWHCRFDSHEAAESARDALLAADVGEKLVELVGNDRAEAHVRLQTSVANGIDKGTDAGRVSHQSNLDGPALLAIDSTRLREVECPSLLLFDKVVEHGHLDRRGTVEDRIELQEQLLPHQHAGIARYMPVDRSNSTRSREDAESCRHHLTGLESDRSIGLALLGRGVREVAEVCVAVEVLLHERLEVLLLSDVIFSTRGDELGGHVGEAEADRETKGQKARGTPRREARHTHTAHTVRDETERETRGLPLTCVEGVCGAESSRVEEEGGKSTQSLNLNLYLGRTRLLLQEKEKERRGSGREGQRVTVSRVQGRMCSCCGVWVCGWREGRELSREEKESRRELRGSTPAPRERGAGANTHMHVAEKQGLKEQSIVADHHERPCLMRQHAYYISAFSH